MALSGRYQTGDVYKRQMRMQESARELNKREQRKFDLELEGKGGLAAEYKFNLEKVNHEQRIIEKELEKIRQGVHRHPGNLRTLSADKKFHHPHFGYFNNPHGNGHRSDDRGRNKSSDGSLDAMALVQYLQEFNAKYTENEEKKVDKHENTSSPCHLNLLNDTKPPTTDECQSITSNQIKSSQAENVIPSNEVYGGEQTADDSQFENRQENELRSNKHSSGKPLSKHTNSFHKSTENADMNAKSNGSGLKDEGKVQRTSLSNVNNAAEIKTSQKETDKQSMAGDFKRVPYVQTTDELKKISLTDPEIYNPDGSIKTAYTMPSFEKRWEEAKNARYIRTKEPLERDRQLTMKEIFDKN